MVVDAPAAAPMQQHQATPLQAHPQQPVQAVGGSIGSSRRKIKNHLKVDAANALCDEALRLDQKNDDNSMTAAIKSLLKRTRETRTGVHGKWPAVALKLFAKYGLNTKS